MNAPPVYQPLRAWSMTAMLTWLAVVNFLDKIVLGLVAVPMMADLHLSPRQFGLVASAFFWLFSVSTIAVGFLANRVATRWLLLGMGLTWGLLQWPMAFASSVGTLVVCRVLLGAAEGPAFTVSALALCKWFPDERRGLPVAVLNQGAAIGLLLAGLGIPLVTATWGWRANFLILGVAGLVWAVVWLMVGREGPLTSAGHGVGGAPGGERVPYRRIFTDPTMWCCVVLGFAAYWTLALVLTWMPLYLEKGLGFGAAAAGRWFAVIILFTMPLMLVLTWVSQRMMRRGISSRMARGVLCGVAAIFGGLVFVLVAWSDIARVPHVLLIALAGGLPSVTFALLPAIVAEFVPEAQRGGVMAIAMAVSTLAGDVAPVVAGGLVHRMGLLDGFHAAFALNGAMLLVAGLAALRWLDPVRSRQALGTGQEPALV